MVAEPVRSRSYRLGRRQEQVDDTRRRIVEAARAMFAEGGFHGVGLDGVARRAGVGRKTIYNHFGSKRELLKALVADLGVRGGVAAFVPAALAQPDVAHALRAMVVGTARFWEAERRVVSAVTALAVTDPDTRSVMAPVYADRRNDMTKLAERARREGRLRRGWTVARAADAWWLLTAPEAYDLQRRLGRSPRQATRLLCDLAAEVLSNEVTTFEGDER